MANSLIPLTAEEEAQRKRLFGLEETWTPKFESLAGQTGEQLYLGQTGGVGKNILDYMSKISAQPEYGFESTLQPNLKIAEDYVNRMAQRRGLLRSGVPIEQMGRAGVELAVREAEARQAQRDKNIGLATEFAGKLPALQQTATQNWMSFLANLQELTNAARQREAQGILTGEELETKKQLSAEQIEAAKYMAEFARDVEEDQLLGGGIGSVASKLIENLLFGGTEGGGLGGGTEGGGVVGTGIKALLNKLFGGGAGAKAGEMGTSVSGAGNAWSDALGTLAGGAGVTGGGLTATGLAPSVAGAGSAWSSALASEAAGAGAGVTGGGLTATGLGSLTAAALPIAAAVGLAIYLDKRKTKGTYEENVANLLSNTPEIKNTLIESGFMTGNNEFTRDPAEWLGGANILSSAIHAVKQFGNPELTEKFTEVANKLWTEGDNTDVNTLLTFIKGRNYNINTLDYGMRRGIDYPNKYTFPDEYAKDLQRIIKKYGLDEYMNIMSTEKGWFLNVKE